jgi:hypothetical protein
MTLHDQVLMRLDEVMQLGSSSCASPRARRNDPVATGGRPGGVGIGDASKVGGLITVTVAGGLRGAN